MGAGKSKNKQVSDSVTDAVMKNIYDLTSSCESSQKQTQNLNVNIEGSLVGGIDQSQIQSSDLSCLSNNKLTSMFDSNFKKTLESAVSNSIKGVGAVGATNNNISEKVANKLYTENSITTMQTAIDSIDQLQTQTTSIRDSVVGQISQNQASSVIMKQVSDIASDALLQSEMEQEMKVTSTTSVTGTDITAIATTAIKTVGSVMTSFTNAFIIGAIIFVVVLVASLIAIIVFIKKNCSSIKNALSKAGSTIPIAGIQLKLVSQALGLFCPGNPPNDAKQQQDNPVAQKL